MIITTYGLRSFWYSGKTNVTQGNSIQLVAFLVAEFPVQFLTKRYGFKYVLPTMMTMWGMVSWSQAFMVNRTGFYVSRAFLGLCEGGFIPGVILMATYFYTSKELSTRLAAFWSTLNVARKSIT
jgi:MFS family permease